MPGELDTHTLMARLRGEALRPGEAGYDDARAVWNAMIDGRPALIVRCAGADDVVEAVRFARANDLLVAVRGGGHNIAGSGVCDGGLLIDLSRLRAVRVDPEARTARVEGGATLADLDRATQAHDLATPGGVISSTGVGGLTLGGGFGWLSRKLGLAVDNLLAVDLVTVAGERVRASEKENPELFWALRGGGGNFGVAVAFEFRLHAVGPEIMFGPTVHRLEDAPQVLRRWRDFAVEASRDACVWADLLTAPPLPFLDARWHGTKVVSLMQCWAGDPAEGERALAPLRGFGAPIGDAVARRPYMEAQSLLDPFYEAGARNYWKADNFAELPDAALDALAERAATLPTPQSDILIHQIGGAVNDVAPDATAYPHRATNFVVTTGARWEEPAQDGACVAWARETAETVAPYAEGGSYVNFMAEPQGRERAAYGANWERLAQVKARWDSTNLFRCNQNVPPAA